MVHDALQPPRPCFVKLLVRREEEIAPAAVAAPRRTANVLVIDTDTAESLRRNTCTMLGLPVEADLAQSADGSSGSSGSSGTGGGTGSNGTVR